MRVALAASLSDIRAILQDPSLRALPRQIDATLVELRAALDGMSPESPIYQSLNSTIQQLNRTLVNVEAVTRTLSGQPNAAIMPSSLPEDPMPEVSPQ